MRERRGSKFYNVKFKLDNDDVSPADKPPLYCPRPNDLNDIQISRYGKSPTQIGVIENPIEDILSEELLVSVEYARQRATLISRQNRNPRLRGYQIRQTIQPKANRFSPSQDSNKYDYNRRRRPSKQSNILTVFAREDDLLYEIFSCLTIAELLQYQCVCKKFMRIIQNTINSCRTITIKPIVIKGETIEPISDSDTDDEEEKGSSSRQSFVLPSTVKRIVHLAGKNVRSLTLDYVVINDEIIEMLYPMNKKLAHLSLGIIKVETYEALDSPDRVIESKDHHRKGSASSPQSSRKKKNQETLDESKKGYGPSYWPYLTGEYVEEILSRCGANIKTLEMSLHIGEMPEGIFAQVPNLTKLTIFDSILSNKSVKDPSLCVDEDISTYEEIMGHKAGLSSTLSHYITCDSDEFDGPVDLKGFLYAMKNIRASDLLQYMILTKNEPLLLINPDGIIVHGNSAVTKVTGMDAEEWLGQSFGIFNSSLTDTTILTDIANTLKTNAPSNEFTTFLKSQNISEEGRRHLAIRNMNIKVFLCQIVICKEIISLKGVEIENNEITENFISQVIEKEFLDEENEFEKQKKKRSKIGDYLFGGKDFLPPTLTDEIEDEVPVTETEKTYTYHLVRLGIICAPFCPVDIECFKELITNQATSDGKEEAEEDDDTQSEDDSTAN